MHSFEHRINQLLDSMPELTAGHRERLVRPLRQDDVVCWQRIEDAGLDAVMKASMRIVAHELLDQICFHIEAALTRCRTESQRLLVMALIAKKMPAAASVMFRSGEQLAGISYPGPETIVLESDAVFPRPNDGDFCVDLFVELIRTPHSGDVDGSPSPAARSVGILVDGSENERFRHRKTTEVPILGLSSTEIAENPFQCASRVYEILRSGELPP